MESLARLNQINIWSPKSELFLLKSEQYRVLPALIYKRKNRQVYPPPIETDGVDPLFLENKETC